METVSSPAAIIRAEEQGERRWFFGGGVHTWKARAAETGGAFLLFEDQMGGGKMTPLHTHPDSDESMYILEGEIIMHMDGVEHRLGAGGLAVAPRGVPHAFMVVSESARMLCLHTPGCCEAFYWDASTPLADGDPSGTGPVDFGKVQESARRNGGIELLGPPPFAPR
ncbi:cupin domain-containing protein [Arthrobacter sp. SO3]|uniref:cupin domain-containing protein n=1 Tax=Arthrobacter sp. SO3 TaxID=1897057 RepID=UPI001CFF9954|nr:cupin domain-containing protein [Arthrobacter sp. SO3]MCB5292828.1 Quercetin 2,3-dioxygenase [Arthrobacter sp. SO3]